MKFILNLIPVIFLAALLVCVFGILHTEWPLTLVISLLPVTSSCFVSSLVWRMTPSESLNKKINAVIFLVIAVLGYFMYADTTLVRDLWFPVVLLVFVSIHLYLFTISANTTLFSGRSVLLMIPILLSAFSFIGLWLWNGTLILATVGLAAAVIFAVLATLLGKPGKFTNHGDIQEPQERALTEE